jgi:hypothetical protein
LNTTKKLEVHDFRHGYRDIFLDTEFLEVPGEKTQLISVAMVEGDRRLYKVSDEFDLELAKEHGFVSRNVLPQLPDSDEWVSEATIRNAMLAFVGMGQTGYWPRIWAWFAGLDYGVIHGLFGGINGWPTNWPMLFHDLASVKNLTAPRMKLRKIYPIDYDGVPHDALYDALQLQAKFFDFCKKLGGAGQEGGPAVQ